MRCGYVVIIGEPNVGKSTLLNRLLGTKLSITSPKPQTTRYKILGILSEEGYQCCFVDTPGIIVPEYELHKVMLEQLKTAIKDADIIIWMFDPWFKAEKFPSDLLNLTKDKTIIAIINKIDLVKKLELLPVIENISKFAVQEVIPVSALTGDGVEELKKIIFRELPEGPFLYPEHDLSDRPERFFVAELIREKIFKFFKKELPYASCVIIDEFKEREKGKDYIRATIYVEKDSQKAILIGRDGSAIKRFGGDVRYSIEDFLGRKVYLDLWVKVKEKWRKDRKFLKELGY